MKKFTFLSMLFCATMINAQNNLYFTPDAEWGNDNAEYSAFLINTSTSAEELIHFTAVEDETNLFVSVLTNTNYDKIRFYRHPAGEILPDQSWGWNCTGQLPFEYVADRYYIMNTPVWTLPTATPGNNDVQYFTVTVRGGGDVLYFTPTYSFAEAGDNWEQFNGDLTPVQGFNAVLINTSTSDVVFLKLNVTSEAHKYSVMLPSVNYDKVRFYRVPPGELISNQEWGWNKTGELPFDYAVCNHYVMTTSVWQPGDNDYQYFQDCGFAAGIENVFANKEVERVEYYNLQGLRLSAEPQEGLFIAVPFYKGNVRGEAVKVLNVR